MSSPIGSRILLTAVAAVMCLTLSACGGKSDDAPASNATNNTAGVTQPVKKKSTEWSKEHVNFISAHMVELDAGAPGRDINHFGYQLCGKQNFSIAINDAEYAASRIFITCNDPYTARVRQARVARAAKR